MIEQLGPYRVERVLGRGGMGAVYAGVGESGERVALKILQPDLAADENFRERFQAEIESLKKLRHPRIVELFGYGEQDGNLFYAMELVEGGSLQDELARGRRFQWRDVTRIAIDICQALKHAHDHGVIHRDLKPANLMLDSEERVKLTDFGIAKLFGARSHTAHGGVMGTADFMAPEQAEGQPATARCDLYSLGCVMFALLAGHPPFRGKSLAEVVHQLRYVEPPRVRHFSWDVPAGLDETIDLLLRKDPQQRIPTALALGNRLQALLHSLSVSPTASTGVEVLDVSNSPTIQYSSAPVSQLPSYVDPGLAARSTAPMQNELDSSVASVATSGRPAKPTDRPTDAAGSRFTTVDKSHFESPDRSSVTDPSPWLLVFVTALFVVVAVTAGVYYWNHQPSADALYYAINAVADGDASEQSLPNVERQIDLFLQYYAADPRYAEVAALHEEIQLGRLKRALEAKSRSRRKSEVITAVERAYLEAIQLSTDNPELAVTHLRALIDLFAGATQDSKDATRCLRLARTKLEALETELSSRQSKDLPILEARLQDAKTLDASDPARAREIRDALIELYQDKPWAANAVRQARTDRDGSGSDQPGDSKGPLPQSSTPDLTP